MATRREIKRILCLMAFAQRKLRNCGSIKDANFLLANQRLVSEYFRDSNATLCTPINQKLREEISA